MSDESKSQDTGEDSGVVVPSGAADRPKTVRFNPSDPSSPGPRKRPTDGLRLDPDDLDKSPPSDNRPLPLPVRDNSGGEISEAETYLGSPSVANSASEFSDKDLDTHNLGVMLQDRYRLQRVLGKGGFGVVYLAHDRVLDQDVAIKVLKLGAATEGYKKRFIFEARTAAKLRHMAIVNVFDIVQTEGGLQLVMEYYPGGTLADLIKREGRVPPKEALAYIRQIALGLAFAHRKGIIHRDIKPANIFFADDETVKLGDFGICASYENHDHTMTGEVIGTPLYMAPEQQKDSKDVDPRADIYALGMTLYHMIVGRPPRVVNLDEVPPRLRPMLQQLTAYDRKERPASCQQLVAMIDQIAKDLGKSDASMRSSDTELVGPGGGAPSDSQAISGGPSGELSGGAPSAGGPGAISTLASDPLPPTGQSTGWNPDEATHTQSRSPGSDTVTTTVVHAPSSTWSMVALVGVVIAGFLAVIFMLVQRGGEPALRPAASVDAPAPRAIARPGEPEDEGPQAANPPSGNVTAEGAGSGAPDSSSEKPAAIQTEEPAQADGGENADPTAAGAQTGAMASAGDGESAGAEIAPGPAPEEAPWQPQQPAWADENPSAGAGGIDAFLNREAGSEGANFTRDTFLSLGDWVDNRDSPTALIFREAAEKRLIQAQDRFPGEAIFPYLLGRFYEATDRRDRALESFGRVRTMDSRFLPEFDRVVLEFIRELKLDEKISQPLRSFLLTPSTIAKEGAG